MEFIRTEISGGVARITLDRPDKLNSFNLQMGKELQKALDDCAGDDSVRCVLLTGSGKGFCAGQDLAEAIGEQAPAIESIVEETYNPIIRRIRQMEKPVIAWVNGVAAGAGANIAFACDITIAVDTASFIQSFSNIGLIPDSGGTYFLPRLAGPQRAAALMFTAGKLMAAQAKEWGLIWDTAPADTIEGTVMELAASLAARPTRGIGLTKKAINAGWNNSLEEQLELEKALQKEAGNTYDYKEGVTAFLEKRQALYKGK